MPRPRKPTEILEPSGAFTKDPQRKRSVGAKSDRALGHAPGHLNEAERNCWKEIVANSAANVLTSSDRIVVELIARLLARFRADWLTGAEMGVLKSSLAELGWTPASRSKVSAPKQDDEPDFSAFLNLRPDQQWPACRSLDRLTFTAEQPLV